jgi:60 kDa SS-A/Ro ribonucleoprotein
MFDPSQHYRTRNTTTPQSEPIPGKDQVQNSAGGYAFAVDDWTRLERFLILGSEGGSYYASERRLTRENAEAVQRCIDADGARAVKTIVEISESGRAPKNDYAVFALAMAAGAESGETRRLALRVLPKVCRIGTHLFHFAAYVEGFRGWGRGLRMAVARWYTARPLDRLVYQLVKYQQRDGWSHRDLLRLAHPKCWPTATNDALRWVVRGEVPPAGVPDLGLIYAFEEAKTADEAKVCQLIRDHGLTREMIPTHHLTSPAVWEALLERMPLEAMIRNLPTMTKVGLLTSMSDATQTVVARLGDADYLHRSRVHPLKVLVALRTYASGKSARGSATWEPMQQIVDALDGAFYAAFPNVESTGKRWFLALDVSGSMGYFTVAGMPGVTPRVAAAAMALVTANTEPRHEIMAFSHELVEFPCSPRERLDDVTRRMEGLQFGATDCALPMLTAMRRRLPVDVFCILTDSETWYGDIHPVEALREYRHQMGIPAKLIVVAMVSNGFSIADPDDAGMLDVIGFDTAVPQVMADFVRGGTGDK